jgi:hypothetical protein
MLDGLSARDEAFFALQIHIPARLHPLRLARHLRSAHLLSAMFTCNYAGGGGLPCTELSGENSPVETNCILGSMGSLFEGRPGLERSAG